MTMAEGVYNNARKPRGPLRDRMRYKKSPTTTGGRPMPVFNTPRISPRRGNRRKANRAPQGTPRSVAKRRAKPDTWRDKPMILTSSGLKVVTRRRAPMKP